MLTIAELSLSMPDGRRLPPSTGSLLQGVLMELVGRELAADLHRPGLRPYSQYLCCHDSTLTWRVTGLTRTAAEKIIRPLLADSLTHIHLRDKGATLAVTQKRLICSTSYQSLTDHFFLASSLPKSILLRFVTPASFRSANRYMIYPSVEHIMQSLYNRWNEFAGRFSLADPDALSHITAHLHIGAYRLHMASFSLEGIRIPAFQGDLRLTLTGPDSLRRIVLLLLAYAEFSGIGIKTAMGMGGSRIWERRRSPRGLISLIPLVPHFS